MARAVQGQLQWIATERGVAKALGEAALARSPGATMTSALGWLSIGLGVTALVAPGAVLSLVGLDKRRDRERARSAVSALGFRELVSGALLMSTVTSGLGLWSRVLGDAMDLALLSGGRSRGDSARNRTATATATAIITGVLLIDLVAAVAGGRARRGATVELRRAVTIRRPVSEVRRRWLELNGGESEASGDVDEGLRWRVLPASTRHSEARVSFRPAPGDQGTEVEVWLTFEQALTPELTKRFGEPVAIGLPRALNHFKQLVEVGEVVHSDASIHDGPHPGQPEGKSDRAGAREGRLAERRMSPRGDGRDQDARDQKGARQ